MVNRNTAGQWLKSSNASGTGKTELHDLPQAILPQLLVLKYLSMLRPLFTRINASQRNKWCSGLQSAKEESHHLRPYIRRGSWDGFLRASQLNTELREWLKERPSYPTLVKQMKPGPSILNWRKKAIHGMAPSSISPELKIQSLHQWAVMIRVFRDCAGAILLAPMLGGDTT